MTLIVLGIVIVYYIALLGIVNLKGKKNRE